GNNMHKQDFTSAVAVFEQHWAAFEELFARYGDRFPDREQLETKAKRGTALNGLRKAGKLFDQGDVAGCRDLLGIVLRAYPELRQEKEWKRLRLKQRLGTTVWSVLRPLSRRVRRRGPLDASPFGSGRLFPGV